MHCTFKLLISQQNTIKCVIIKEDKTEELITLETNKEEYPIQISCTTNEIVVCQKQENTIDFMNDWIKESNLYKKYSFTFQGKQHEAIAEILFALVINEFKNKVTKKYIIDETLVEIPSNDYTLLRRMKIALESTGLNYVFFNDDSIYDYTEQGYLLRDLITQNEEFKKYKQKFESLKGSLDENQLQQIEKKEFTQSSMYEMSLKFTTKQKEKLGLYTLDNYCVFIASKYFNSFQDHVNLTFVSKRFR